jgi:hypothetical protein
MDRHATKVILVALGTVLSAIPGYVTAGCFKDSPEPAQTNTTCGPCANADCPGQACTFYAFNKAVVPPCGSGLDDVDNGVQKKHSTTWDCNATGYNESAMATTAIELGICLTVCGVGTPVACWACLSIEMLHFTGCGPDPATKHDNYETEYHVQGNACDAGACG